jgi:hypothetical protein
VVQDYTQNRSWTQEPSAAGYAVAWMRYRAEVDYAYDRVGRLIEDRRQNRQLLNRGPLEYDDVISIAEYVKTLPGIAADAQRNGWQRFRREALDGATVNAGDLCGLDGGHPVSYEISGPDATAHVNPSTGLLNVERMMMREPAKVRGRITEDVAQARMRTIATPILVQGRNSDELQGIFRVCYDLLVELGKDAQWATYEHDVHGFVYVRRNDAGIYQPDAVQMQAVDDSIAFFDKHLKQSS